MNTMRYLCSLFGASTDDLVTAETPAGLLRLGAERLMGSSQELQELIMVEGSKMMVDASSDVRAQGRHLWSELVQHAKTEQMLKQYLREVDLRNIKKTLDSLK